MKKYIAFFISLLLINSALFAQIKTGDINHLDCQEAFVSIIQENQNQPEWRRHIDSELKCELFLKTELADCYRANKNYAKECTKYARDLCPELVRPATTTDVMSRTYGTSGAQLKAYVAGLMGYGLAQTPKLFAKKQKPDEMISSASDTKQSQITKSECENGKMPTGVLKREWDLTSKDLAQFDTKRCKIKECDTDKYYVLKDEKCLCDSSKGFVMTSRGCSCPTLQHYIDKTTGKCTKKECEKWEEFDITTRECIEKKCPAGTKANHETGECTDCIDAGYHYDYQKTICIKDAPIPEVPASPPSSPPLAPSSPSTSEGTDLEMNQTNCNACGAFYDDEIKECVWVIYHFNSPSLVSSWSASFIKVKFGEASISCPNFDGRNLCAKVKPAENNYSTFSKYSYTEWLSGHFPNYKRSEHDLLFGGDGENNISLSTDLTQCVVHYIK